MEIHESKIYRFVFPFMGDGIINLNVAANTQHDAAVFLKEWMSRTQLELAMQFPEVSPTNVTPTTFNAMQLGLLEDLAKACNLDVANFPQAIKKATGLDMTLENFKEIVPALEALRDGKTDYGKKKS